MPRDIRFTLGMTITLSLAALPSTTFAQQEPRLLVCQDGQGNRMTIDLFSESEFGPVHCISGFPIADMTPCAPDGGWGLSAGTGLAPLTEITRTWAPASSHLSGKFYAELLSDKFIARAHHGEGLEADFTDPYSYDLELSVDRTTGQGVFRSGDNAPVAIACSIQDRQF